MEKRFVIGLVFIAACQGDGGRGSIGDEQASLAESGGYCGAQVPAPEPWVGQNPGDLGNVTLVYRSEDPGGLLAFVVKPSEGTIVAQYSVAAGDRAAFFTVASKGPSGSPNKLAVTDDDDDDDDKNRYAMLAYISKRPPGGPGGGGLLDGPALVEIALNAEMAHDLGVLTASECYKPPG